MKKAEAFATRHSRKVMVGAVSAALIVAVFFAGKRVVRSKAYDEPKVQQPSRVTEVSEELLAEMMMQIIPNGTLLRSGSLQLVIGTRRYEAGKKFTVLYKDREYGLELIAVTSRTFTVGSGTHTICRPLKSAK